MNFLKRLLVAIRSASIFLAIAIQISHGFNHPTAISSGIAILGALGSQMLLACVDALFYRASPSRIAIPALLLAILSLELRGGGSSNFALIASAGLIEIAFLAIVLFVSFRKATMGIDASAEERIAAAFSFIVADEIANFFAKEICIVFASARFLASPLAARAARSGEFGYRNSPTMMLLPALSIFVVPEAITTHLFLLNHHLINLILLVVQAYGVIWALGVFQLFRERPHCIGTERAVFHCGIFKTARIDLIDIIDVGEPKVSDEGSRRKLGRIGYNMTVPDLPVLKISLATSQPFASALFGRPLKFDSVYVSADDANALRVDIVSKKLCLSTS